MVDVIDPRITAGIGGSGAQINPLALVEGFARTQNALNQNALFQQTFRARQALGQLMPQAVDQQGNVDWNKLVTLAATHPETAFIAQDIANNAASKKLIDAETTNQELNATKGRMDIMAGVWSAAAKDSTVNDVSDLSPYMTQAMSLGGIKNPKDAVAFMADPKIQGLKGPQFRQMLLSHALAMQHGSSALTAMNNSFSPDAFHDVNGNAIPGWINPIRQTAVPASAGPAAAMSAGPTAGAGAVTQPQEGESEQAPTGPMGTPMLGAPGPIRQQQLQQAAQYGKDVAERAGNANQLNLLFQQVGDTLKHFEPNKGMSQFAQLAGLAKTVGLPDKYIDQLLGASKDGLDNVQEAQKLFYGIGSMVAAQYIRSMGNARVTQQEWIQTLLHGAPNVDMTRGGISKIMSAMRELASYSGMENRYFQRKASMPNYYMGNVMNDWQQTYSDLLSQKAGAR